MGFFDWIGEKVGDAFTWVREKVENAVDYCETFPSG